MSLLLAQALSGLASAASLFLVACGLSIIFGVTRIVNFAHGAFFMLGAYAAFTLTERLEGAVGFWGGLALAAVLVAGLGVLVEMTLLRRIYRAPELLQLVATFGVTLVVQDLVLLVWGPEDRLGRRAPGFRGAVEVLGERVPAYDLFLIALGPLVLGALWLLFRRTRWGVLVRAATQDRDMVAALGIDQKWLFTSVFALGIFLAALGGALQIPREAVSPRMDLAMIVEAFVVVVVGGLGSVVGAFVAAVLIAEINAFGILVLPKVSLVAVFAVMALVLVARPFGLFGRREEGARGGFVAGVRPWAPFPGRERAGLALALLALAVLVPLAGGAYALNVAAEIAVFALFAGSLQFLMSAGGLASFGHAAFFGLGAYGAAFAARAGLPLPVCLVAGPGFALAGALLAGPFCVRLSGVYFAMLTLAVAQIAWSAAVQWVEVTGGDNGILGVWPPAYIASPAAFYWLCLGVSAAGLGLLRVLTFSPFGYALRAARDAPDRAAAIGIGRAGVQLAAFAVAAAFAGLAGALFAFHKGTVFPDTLAVPVSVDGLVMVLLGGVETASGAVLGAVAYKALSIWLTSQTDHARLVLGLVIVGLVVAFPGGIAGEIEALRARWSRPRIAAAPVLAPERGA